MEALQHYLSSASESEADEEVVASPQRKRSRSVFACEQVERPREEEEQEQSAAVVCLALPSKLPPPPKDLLTHGNGQSLQVHASRARSFPHVDGNFALHVYIPVVLSITSNKTKLVPALQRASNIFPQLQLMEDDVPLKSIFGTANGLMSAASTTLAKEYHISLSRTVPIRIHQIDSIVSILRHKFCNQRRHVIEFGKWEVFVNDERTRSFLALEILKGGLQEIQHQVCLVNDAYKLHDLPLYYKNARPHISIAWALGDVPDVLRKAADELNKMFGVAEGLQKVLYSCSLNKVLCKIGQQVYPIWTSKMTS